MNDAWMQRIEAELERLRAQVALRRNVAIDPPSPIVIIGGQLLGTYGGIDTYGIMKYSGTLSGITTQTYDPGTVNPTTGAQTGGPSPGVSAWPSGLGYGIRWTGFIWERVIVVNDSRGTMATALIGGASDDTTYAPTYRQVTILSGRRISVTKADSSTIKAWSPDLG